MTDAMAGAAGRARQNKGWLVYAVSFGLVAATASVGGIIQPGTWYAALTKPAWTPPNWLFGPVWGLLYVMIAVAGARAWQAGASAGTLALWVVQLLLNGAWTWLFFGLHRPDLGLVDIAALLAVIALFALHVWPVSSLSALLFLPYFAWVGFATALNWAIWRLN